PWERRRRWGRSAHRSRGAGSGAAALHRGSSPTCRQESPSSRDSPSGIAGLGLGRPPAGGLGGLGGRGGVGRGRGGGLGLAVDLRADAELLLDLLLDAVGQVGVGLEEVAGVLLALAELVAVVGVPGAGLADEAVLHAEVDQAALAADALAVEQVEVGDAERRGHLVLD